MKYLNDWVMLTLVWCPLSHLDSGTTVIPVQCLELQVGKWQCYQQSPGPPASLLDWGSPFFYLLLITHPAKHFIVIYTFKLPTLKRNYSFSLHKPLLIFCLYTLTNVPLVWVLLYPLNNRDPRWNDILFWLFLLPPTSENTNVSIITAFSQFGSKLIHKALVLCLIMTQKIICTNIPKRFCFHLFCPQDILA